MTTPAAGQFVVLVAPFQDAEWRISQTGSEIAAALVDELPQTSGGRVVARTLAAPPANDADALVILSREDADVLIWGQVTLGGMLDRPSLLPILAYQPSGSSAPISWDGYAGRFSLPNALPLASAPINGHRGAASAARRTGRLPERPLRRGVQPARQFTQQLS